MKPTDSTSTKPRDETIGTPRGTDFPAGPRACRDVGPRLSLATVLFAVIACGAGPPEVVRVRVPADKVSEFFPPGTELRGLSAGQFEELVASARAGSRRQEGLAAPRLLRARHSAR